MPCIGIDPFTRRLLADGKCICEEREQYCGVYKLHFCPGRQEKTSRPAHTLNSPALYQRTERTSCTSVYQLYQSGERKNTTPVADLPHEISAKFTRAELTASL